MKLASGGPGPQAVPVITRDEAVQYLSGLSPVELQRLVEELEGVWRIVHPPVDEWYIPIDVVQEPDLVLVEVGPRRVLVMKALRAEFGFDLAKVRALVDTTPAVLAYEAEPSVAERVIRELGSLGASVERRPGVSSWARPPGPP